MLGRFFSAEGYQCHETVEIDPFTQDTQTASNTRTLCRTQPSGENLHKCRRICDKKPDSIGLSSFSNKLFDRHLSPIAINALCCQAADLLLACDGSGTRASPEELHLEALLGLINACLGSRTGLANSPRSLFALVLLALQRQDPTYKDLTFATAWCAG